MNDGQAIIVKKIKKGGHAHHGGAWKVAFADFVTAMMAFFLLMWLMGSTTPEERAAISDYFQNPSAVQGPGGASTSMIKLGGEGTEKASGKSDRDKNFEGNPDSTDAQNQGAEKDQDFKNTKVVDRDEQKDAERLDALKQDLEKAIEASQALKPFKDQLLLDITPEGLRIQIIDKENRPMFSIGSSILQPYTIKILKEIAVVISKVPNKISLTGHTDATPYRNFSGHTNWELSTDRANASRRALVRGGLPPAKIAKVVGLSSTVLFDVENPFNPINRRISLIVMNKHSEDQIVENAHALEGTLAEHAAPQEGSVVKVLPSKKTQHNKRSPETGTKSHGQTGPENGSPAGQRPKLQTF